MTATVGDLIVQYQWVNKLDPIFIDSSLNYRFSGIPSSARLAYYGELPVQNNDSNVFLVQSTKVY